ncbi:MAG: HEAT repeat domain-containing protein [Desulfovibrio sp.]
MALPCAASPADVRKIPAPDLVRQLDDKNEEVRNAAQDELIRRSAEAVPALVDALRGTSAPLRGAATQLLSRIGAPAVPELARALEDQSRTARIQSSIALGLMGSGAADAVRPLARALDDHVEDVRGNAAAALAEIGADAAQAAPELERLLKDPSPWVRRNSAMALGRIGPGARDSAEALMLAMREDSSPKVRTEAVRSLGKVDPDLDSALDALNSVISGDSTQSVRDAASEIVKIFQSKQKEDRQASESDDVTSSDPGTAPAEGSPVADLVRDLGKDEPTARSAADLIVHRGADAAPALAWALDSDDPTLRRRAAETLGRLGPDSAPARAALARSLSDTDARVREHVARALGSMGPTGLHALDELTRALNDTDPLVRVAAAKSLASFGPNAAPAVSGLAALLRRGPDQAVEAGARALGNIGPKAAQAVNNLRDALTGGDPDARAAAAEALGKIGPMSMPALPNLRALKNDPVRAVRQAAETALRAIDPTGAVSDASLADHSRTANGSTTALPDTQDNASDSAKNTNADTWPTSLEDLEPDPRYPDFAPQKQAEIKSASRQPHAEAKAETKSTPEASKSARSETVALQSATDQYSGDAQNRDYVQARQLLAARRYAEAAAPLLRAAEDDHSPSQVLLGELNRDGKLGVPDNEQALRWFRRASALGDAAGYYNMGWMYEHGLGVDKNADTALRWYDRAVKRGYRGARDRANALRH